ncbi:hypothetical protein [Nocardia heshunensis]
MSKKKHLLLVTAGFTSLGIAAVSVGASSATSAATDLDHDGVYAVPGDATSGQYQTNHFSDDCAFSVSDAAGNVLVSGGAASVNRGVVQVEIPDNAASFSTTDCGVWHLVYVGRQPPASGSSALGL